MHLQAGKGFPMMLLYRWSGLELMPAQFVINTARSDLKQARSFGLIAPRPLQGHRDQNPFAKIHGTIQPSVGQIDQAVELVPHFSFQIVCA